MAIHHPGRHPAFPPLNKLRSSPLSGGKKGVMLDLNLTPMVDMFTVIVIFLLQSFSASGDLMFTPGITLPVTKASEMFEERGPVISFFEGEILLEGKPLIKASELDEAEPGIPPLAEELKGIREREEELAARRGKPRDPTEPFEGHLVLMADEKTDFMLVRRVIYTANVSGWMHINFIVRGSPKDLAEIEASAAAGAAAEG